MREGDEKTANAETMEEPAKDPAEEPEVDRDAEETVKADVEEETEEPVEEPPEVSEEAVPLEGELGDVAEAEGVESVEEMGPEEALLEEKRPSRREVEEEEFVEERTYTIPLRKAWIAPSGKRAPRAVKIIKQFINRHMKVESRAGLEEEEEPKKLILSNELNERIWRRGIQKPPRRVRVRAAKDKDGNVTLFLAEGD